MSPVPSVADFAIYVTDHAVPRPFVLVDTRTWAWHPEDREHKQPPSRSLTPGYSRARTVRVPPPRGKRRVQLGNGNAKTGINTGLLVLTRDDYTSSALDDTTALLTVATSLVHKAAQGELPFALSATYGLGQYGGLTELLSAYGLALDLVAPDAFRVTLAEYLEVERQREVERQARHEAEEAEEAVRQARVDALTVRLADLGIIFSETDIDADVRESGEDLVDMSYATLLTLLTLAEAGQEVAG